MKVIRAISTYADTDTDWDNRRVLNFTHVEYHALNLSATILRKKIGTTYILILTLSSCEQIFRKKET